MEIIEEFKFFKSNYISLCNHTEYSYLKSNIKIKDLSKYAKENNIKAMGLTDLKNMFATIEFYKEMKKEGIKPLIGIEIEVFVDYENELNEDDIFSLAILVKNQKGYENLCKLVSTKMENCKKNKNENHYNLIKLENILKCKDIIVIFKTNKYNFYNDRKVRFKKEIDKLQENFKDDFYLEVAITAIPVEEPSCNWQKIINDFSKFDINLVLTQDIYFIEENKDLFQFYDSLNEQKELTYYNYYSCIDDYFSLYESKDNLKKMIPCILNATKIVKKIDFEINFENKYLPIFDIKRDLKLKNQNPLEIDMICNNFDKKSFFDDFRINLNKQRIKYEQISKEYEKLNNNQKKILLDEIEKNNKKYLKYLCVLGFINKYVKNKENDLKILTIAKKRLNYELSVINQMGFNDYFLIVYEFVKFAKNNNIMVGPGRGSGGGSIVSYCLDITEIDPIKYDLIFERFLNINRITMPDLDIDFESNRRKEVIEHVENLYNEKNENEEIKKVVNIITFDRFKIKSSFNETIKFFLKKDEKNFDKEVKELKNCISNKEYGIDAIMKSLKKFDLSIDEYLNELNKKTNILSNKKIKKIIKLAKSIENTVRNLSIHAAGIIVAPKPMYECIPTYKLNDLTCSQYNMIEIEELGLLKIDFLGLITLDIIKETIKDIQKFQPFDINKINMQDENVYKMISKGDTFGIFQLESKGMQQFIKELQPRCLEDLIAGISIFRPGPMEERGTYIKNKNNLNAIKYSHPLLKDILDVTYGCIIYQEQVMQIVRSLAGYSYSRADNIRRAMSKKKIDIMEKEREVFIYGLETENEKIEGCLKRGVSIEIANNIYDEMINFAKYAFNKSHAVAYATIAYKCAYLKYYYRIEFYKANLNGYIFYRSKLKSYLELLKNDNIIILSPDINKSEEKFTIDTIKNYKFLRLGFIAIKDAGSTSIESIINERKKNGEYKSFEDFLKRNLLIIDKRILEALLYSGSFDSLIKRVVIEENMQKILKWIEISKVANKKQLSLNEKEQKLIDLNYNFYDEKREHFKEKEKIYLGIEIDDFNMNNNYYNKLKTYKTFYENKNIINNLKNDKILIGEEKNNISQIVKKNLQIGDRLIKNFENKDLEIWLRVENLNYDTKIKIFDIIKYNRGNHKLIIFQSIDKKCFSPSVKVSENIIKILIKIFGDENVKISYI